MPSLMMPVMPLLQSDCDCLVNLYMDHNPLTGEAAVNIVNSLKANITLSELGLPKYSGAFRRQLVHYKKLLTRKEKIEDFKLSNYY